MGNQRAVAGKKIREEYRQAMLQKYWFLVARGL